MEDSKIEKAVEQHYNGFCLHLRNKKEWEKYKEWLVVGQFEMSFD